MTLVNTHANQTIETGDRFEDNLNARFAKRHLRKLSRMWRTLDGDVVVGAGDYNFDHADDDRARPAGGITRRFGGAAVSTYQAFGLEGLWPTRHFRWIDYVFLSTDTMRTRRHQGRAQFASHRVLGGFHSDHAPLLARIRLYG